LGHQFLLEENEIRQLLGGLEVAFSATWRKGEPLPNRVFSSNQPECRQPPAFRG